MKQELELYIHVPFCRKKCLYCDFLSFEAEEHMHEAYVRALCEELEEYRQMAREYRLVTIFFGGGTPSVISSTYIEDIMCKVRDIFDMDADTEVTLEANPGTLTKEKLTAYRRAGINRLSIGLQSASDGELKLLGRIHTWSDFQHSYELARACGFDNINIDLMSALPGQTVESWLSSLEAVLKYEPEHISAYSLIIEPDTPFYERYGDEQELPADEALPGEEEDRQMYVETKRVLHQHGYERYEISNYAKPGYECRHNIGYWIRRAYIGVGIGAASLLDECRLKNTTDLADYLTGSVGKDEEVQITESEQMEEFMFLGLRMSDGVSRERFFSLYGKQMEDVYGRQISRLRAEELLAESADGYRLTDKGMDLSNYVSEMFLL